MTLKQHIESKSIPDGNGCWIWQANLDRSGYGKCVYYRGRRFKAHRAAYMAYIGQIPDGMEIDHLCRVRRCVNPEHLEPVTKLENWRRGDAPSRINADKTHCAHGHEFSPENTYVHPRLGHRTCRTCNREYARRARRRAVA